MTTVDTNTTEHTRPEPPLRDLLCQKAIEHFGRFGFDQSLLELSIAADVDVEELTELFGSVEGLRSACDDYLQESVRAAKTEALTSRDPTTWRAQLASIESYVPAMSYLVRSLDAGDASGHGLFNRMTENIEGYLAAAVDAGTVRTSSDPAGRARLLALFGAGGFLLYLQMHPTPDDMGAVLRDYVGDVLVPAMELYTYGLMTDDTMYRTLTTRKPTA